MTRRLRPPQPAARRKPMVVWAVVNRYGHLFDAEQTRREAEFSRDLRDDHIPDDGPWRIARCVEQPPRRRRRAPQPRSAAAGELTA